MQYHVNFDIWDWLIFKAFWLSLLIERSFTSVSDIIFSCFEIFLSSLWLQTETLVERKVNNTTETAKPFGDKKVNFKFSPSLFFYNFFVLINLVIKFLLTITDILQSEILCPHHREGRIKQHSPWKHIFEQTFYLFLIISISGLISKPLKSMISPVSSGMKTLISGIWFLLAVMRNHMHQQSL